MASFRGMPPANVGYNRSTDWPTAGGAMALNTNSTATGNPTTWHPTIQWIIGFVIAELVAFHLLSQFLHL